MAYQYDIRYKQTDEHGNADGLSRLPMGPDDEFDVKEQRENVEISHLVEESLDGLPLTSSSIRKKSMQDPTLKAVSKLISGGDWSKVSDKESADLSPYLKHKEALWMQDDIILLQRDSHSRVVIPKPLQQ